MKIKTSRALLIALLWGNRNELHHRAYLAIIKALQCACARYVRYYTDIQGASQPPPCKTVFKARVAWRSTEVDWPLYGAWQWQAGVLGEGCGDVSPRKVVIFWPAASVFCWPARSSILWVTFIWRRALAPCIARHFIHPERREGWYYRVSNHFLKAY